MIQTNTEGELLQKANDLVVSTQIAKIGNLQRTLRIDYLTAKDLMDKLIEHKIVSAPDENNRYKVLVSPQ